MSHCMLAGSQRERRAVCIERCMHGSEGGVGAFSQETTRAYLTETPLGGSGRPHLRPSRARSPRLRGRARSVPGRTSLPQR